MGILVSAEPSFAQPPPTVTLPPASQDTWASSAPRRQSVVRLAETIQRLSDAGRYGEALTQIERLLSLELAELPHESPDRGVSLPVAEDRAVGLTEWVRLLVGGWPDAGLAVYRQRYDRTAAEQLAKARQRLDVSSALAVWRGYRHTAAAPEAAELAADLLTEQGRPDIASVLRSQAADHPLCPAGRRGMLRFRAGLEAIWADDLVRAHALEQQLRRVHAELRVDGQPAGELLQRELVNRERLRATARVLPAPPPAEPDHPQPDGGPVHRRARAQAVSAEVLLGSFSVRLLLRPELPELPPSDTGADWTRSLAELTASAAGAGEVWPLWVPTVSAGRVVIADDRSVAVVRLLPTEFLGRSTPLPLERTGTGRVRTALPAGARFGEPHPRCAVLVGDHAVLAAGPSYPLSISTWRPNGRDRLRCFGLTPALGDRLPEPWQFRLPPSADPAEPHGPNASPLRERPLRRAELDRAFLDVPLVSGDWMYAVIRGRGGSSLLGLTLGRPSEHERLLPRLGFCTGLGAARPPREEVGLFHIGPAGLTSDAQAVYVATQQGSIVAVHPNTGELLWFADTLGRRSWEPPLAESLTLSAPLAEGGRLWVLTAERQPELLCLSAEDGRLLWRANAANQRLLLGRVGERVLTVGDESVRAWQADTGRALWTFTPPSTQPAGRLSGMPTLAGGRVLYPGTAGLLAIEVTGAEPVVADWRPDRANLGHLLAWGGLLIAVSGDRADAPARLRVFADWAGLEPHVSAVLTQPDAVPAVRRAKLAELLGRLARSEVTAGWTPAHREAALRAAVALWASLEPEASPLAEWAGRQRFTLLADAVRRRLADRPGGGAVPPGELQTAASELAEIEPDRFGDRPDNQHPENWPQRAEYRLLSARLLERLGRAVEAVAEAQRVLNDSRLSEAMVPLAEGVSRWSPTGMGEPPVWGSAWSEAAVLLRRLRSVPEAAEAMNRSGQAAVNQARSGGDLTARRAAVEAHPFAEAVQEELLSVAEQMASDSGSDGATDARAAGRAADWLTRWDGLLEPACARRLRGLRLELLIRAGRLGEARRLSAELTLLADGKWLELPAVPSEPVPARRREPLPAEPAPRLRWALPASAEEVGLWPIQLEAAQPDAVMIADADSVRLYRLSDWTVRAVGVPDAPTPVWTQPMGTELGRIRSAISDGPMLWVVTDTADRVCELLGLESRTGAIRWRGRLTGSSVGKPMVDAEWVAVAVRDAQTGRLELVRLNRHTGRRHSQSLAADASEGPRGLLAGRWLCPPVGRVGTVCWPSSTPKPTTEPLWHYRPPGADLSRWAGADWLWPSGRPVAAVVSQRVTGPGAAGVCVDWLDPNTGKPIPTGQPRAELASEAGAGLPAWAADGARLAVSVGRRLIVLTAGSDMPSWTAELPGQPIGRPMIQPGRVLVLVSSAEPDGRDAVHIWSAEDGRSLGQVLLPVGADSAVCAAGDWLLVRADGELLAWQLP